MPISTRYTFKAINVRGLHSLCPSAVDTHRVRNGFYSAAQTRVYAHQTGTTHWLRRCIIRLVTIDKRCVCC